MANVSEFRSVLYDIRRRLLERHAFLYGDGVGVDDPEYDKEQQIFEDLQARLSIAIKKYQDSRRAKGAKDDVPLREAIELQRDLKKFAAKNQAMNPIQAAAEAWDHAHEYHESQEHQSLHHNLHTEISGGDGRPNVPAEHPSYAQSFEAVVLWIFVAVQSYQVYMKRKKNGK